MCQHTEVGNQYFLLKFFRKYIDSKLLRMIFIQANNIVVSKCFQNLQKYCTVIKASAIILRLVI